MRRLFLNGAGLILALGAAASAHGQAPGAGGWKAHSMDRPKPPVITPPRPADAPPVPPIAVVLFDGRNLSQWTTPDGGEPGWTVRDGYLEVAPGSGPIRTREAFGDVQLHIEWAAPDPPTASGQDRGNSGVFLMGRYEVQVLDSHGSDTYADGQAAAVYGQYPPRFNATRAPGEWQTYDIYFRRPRFGADGALREPARVTVVHNGVLVQNNEELLGQTAWLKFLPYEAHADKLPIELQDHGSPVRFRNIWAVPLPELPLPASRGEQQGPIALSAAELDRFVGRYDRPGADAPIQITREGDHLVADFFWRPGGLAMVPVTPNEFVLRDTDGRIVFELDPEGQPSGLVFHLGGARMPARRAR
jgi:hypothetical protein